MGIFWVLAAPMCAASRITERSRVNPHEGKRQHPDAEWTSREICLECEEVHDHLFLRFRDEGVTESECQGCRCVREVAP